jgi:uncharacterized protein (DUF1501 family)
MEGTVTSNGSRQKSLVFIQLSGGNDALNTVIPYTDEHYFDFRPSIAFKPDSVIKLNEQLGLNPNLAPIKGLWDEGKVAVINGIGYPNPNRSHFRSMDIWHTAEPTKVAQEGWLGQAVREIDPRGENVLTAVNFGRGLPRALASRGVPVASVGNLATYGLYPDIRDEQIRSQTLDMFSQMYSGTEANDMVKKFIRQTGTGALRGADILRSATARYSSSVEYASNSLAQSMRDIAQVMFADLGTRIYYTGQGGYDTHAGEVPVHSGLMTDLSSAVADFMDDLEEHGRDKDTVIVIFSEFGRRIKDNGSGTDHGSGGVAFVIGGSVKGGLYGDYPSLKPEDQLEGDLHFNNDFRSTYTTLLEDWLGLDAPSIVNGTFEKIDFIRR